MIKISTKMGVVAAQLTGWGLVLLPSDAQISRGILRS
jgi:hypothetical protein